jgi:xanthine dehydrogenase molybdopterin-binding subunit B
VLTAADVPGTNAGMGSPYLFVPVGQLVETVGAPLGIVVATSEAAANQAASMVRVTYAGDADADVSSASSRRPKAMTIPRWGAATPAAAAASTSTKPITTLEQAIAKKSFFDGGTNTTSLSLSLSFFLSFFFLLFCMLINFYFVVWCCFGAALLCNVG